MERKPIDTSLCDAMWAITEEGRQARRTSAANPYAANTPEYILHMLGWCAEDFRIGLLYASPQYEKEQASRGDGIAALPAGCYPGDVEHAKRKGVS